MFSLLVENCVFSIKSILSQTNFILSFGENQKENTIFSRSGTLEFHETNNKFIIEDFVVGTKINPSPFLP
mgnify:FL=1